MIYNTFDDFAIILTWPDATIRGDEKWMMFFKKIGVVKNLNFKVGHTAIVLINHNTGSMHFYDFGRYITPRGYGRARSEQTDPQLKINIKAKIKEGKILNIEEILLHFEQMKPMMYGEGKLYFSIVHSINFQKAKAYGDKWVIQGTYPYGAVAKKNNNCSRFITRMLIKSSTKYHFWHYINFPETIKASPISNVVNTSPNRLISTYTPSEGIKQIKMNRFQSFFFLIKQLGDNVIKKRASLLPTDQIIGEMDYTYKPINIPSNSHYLGGVGDGAWFHVEKITNKQLLIRRYTRFGILEYTVLGESNIPIHKTENIKITYDSHFLFTHIIYENQKIKLTHTKNIDSGLQKEIYS